MKFVPNTIYTIGILLFADTCFAQGSQAPPPPTGPTPVGLPIDFGISFLLVIGLLFSFYKFKSFLKHKKTPV